ncbi:hypothetical protein AcV5_007836 [Taiwanofungus camphoratus]|nr:hypothetical protein AcV5_007836 [Antrodia cinnamomea]KAI0947143.1 hypothetical protein AcV7_009645 [Antrodia cinnamomea]
MIPSIQSRALRACVSLPFHIRSLATHATTLPSTTSAPAAASSPNLPSVPQPSTPNNAEEGPLRPHLNIPVDPNHGLWAFFRRKVDKGVVSYDTVEAPHPGKDFTGRSWTAAELRRKSFKDLHTLWYVLLRERNLLATQNEEARRLQIRRGMLLADKKALRCRKSMARIKYVINERRLAYEGAMKIIAGRRETELAARRERREAKMLEANVKIEAEAAAKARVMRQEVGEARSAARLVEGGLFDVASQGVGQASGSTAKQS